MQGYVKHSIMMVDVCSVKFVKTGENAVVEDKIIIIHY